MVAKKRARSKDGSDAKGSASNGHSKHALMGFGQSSSTLSTQLSPQCQTNACSKNKGLGDEGHGCKRVPAQKADSDTKIWFHTDNRNEHLYGRGLLALCHMSTRKEGSRCQRYRTRLQDTVSFLSFPAYFLCWLSRLKSYWLKETMTTSGLAAGTNEK